MSPRTRRAAASQPAVYMTDADHRRLSLLVGSSASASLGAELLREELDRAIIIGPSEAPRRFAKVDSTVTYEDPANGKARTVQLVMPEAADIDENRISVLSPVGAALLGLTAGQVFAWETDTDRARSVRILEVEHRDEASKAL